MSETIYALSSGAPPAGIGVIRISGPGAGAALERLSGGLPPERSPRLRTLRDGAGDTLDQALVLWFRGPATVTGEDLAEIHCHGGRAVIAAILEELGTYLGLREAEPGEFTRRAFGNGKIDLAEAEGLADLLSAETEMQRRGAMLSVGGELSRRIEGWRERALGFAAAVEAVIDFADEDLPDGFGEDAAEYAAEVAAAHAKAVAEQREEEEAAERAAARDAAAEALAAAEGEDAPSLRSGRPKWTPIKGELKKATLQQVLHSTQWNDKDREKAEAFWKRWLEESTAWRAQQEEKLRRRKDAEELKARAREKRAKAHQEKVEADQKSYDEWMERRTFQRDISQGADRERKEKRRLGEWSVRSEVTDKRAKTLGKIFVSQAPHMVTAGKRAAALNELLEEAKSTDYWVRCMNCNKWHKLAEGELRPKKDVFFDCAQVGQECQEEKPAPAKRQKKAGKRH